MAIWGIGAYYSGSKLKDKTGDFIKNRCACVGWDEKEAPAINKMLGSVKTGDLIYIKSFTRKKLRIKAVGIVKDATIKKYASLGSGIKVEWKNEFTPGEIIMTQEMNRNNVYNNSLYEEYNDSISKVIIDALIR